MKADASNLAIVEFEVVDDKGNRCPTTSNMADFKVEHAGTFIGEIAQGSDNYITQVVKSLLAL